MADHSGRAGDQVPGTYNVHALGVPRQEVSKTPAWRQAVYWARLGCVDEVRKLSAIPDEEDLQANFMSAPSTAL